MYKCWNGRAKQFMKVSCSSEQITTSKRKGKKKKKRMGERTAFWKTLVKVRVSPCGHFPEGNHCFPTRLPNQDIFYDSHFNPAVILSKASQRSQRHQPDKFLSCDARELTETLVNRLTCLQPMRRSCAWGINHFMSRRVSAWCRFAYDFSLKKNIYIYIRKINISWDRYEKSLTCRVKTLELVASLWSFKHHFVSRGGLVLLRALECTFKYPLAPELNKVLKRLHGPT